MIRNWPAMEKALFDVCLNVFGEPMHIEHGTALSADITGIFDRQQQPQTIPAGSVPRRVWQAEIPAEIDGTTMVAEELIGARLTARGVEYRIVRCTDNLDGTLLAELGRQS